jgi:hypothetical protein
MAFPPYEVQATILMENGWTRQNLISATRRGEDAKNPRWLDGMPALPVEAYLFSH